MKKQMGRPNGHSPKDPIIQAMSAAIKALVTKRKQVNVEHRRVNAELRDLHRRLSAYRQVVTKQRRPKRVRKASAPKSKTLYGVNTVKKSKKSK